MSARPRWSSWPLRVQLVVVVDLLVALALIVSALATNVVLERSLTQRVDDRLSEQVHVFSDRPSPGPGGMGGPGPRQLPSEFFVQWYDASGEAFARAADPQLPAAAYPDLPTTLEPGAGTPLGPTTVEAVGDETAWRVVLADAQDGGTVAVALDVSDVAVTMARLRWIEILIAVIVLAALALVSWAVVRAALRPLVRVERTAEAIAAGDLSARVPDDDPRTEVGALSESLNTMLGRIEAAVHSREEAARQAQESEDRMRRFVADASHELRTPLTSIRGFAELYGRGAASDEATTDRFMARIEQEATRMGVLVEDLLLLARLDQQRPLRRDVVDLREIALDASEDARVTRPERAVVGPRADGPPVLVVGDADRLRQVVGNLVGNVLVHTPEDTTLTVSVDTVADTGMVTVGDDGPGMAPEQAERAFERFYRAEASRNRSDGGSGLGLAIVSALVAGHGGSVDLDSAPGEGTRVTVTLPLAEVAPEPV